MILDFSSPHWLKQFVVAPIIVDSLGIANKTLPR